MKIFLKHDSFFSLCFLAALVTDCTHPKLSKNEIRFRLPNDPPTFDWNLGTDNVSFEVAAKYQSGLIFDDENSKTVPDMAESWTMSSDLKTYTFHLRHGIRWSDGRALVAQDYVDSWERLLNPKTGAEYAYALFDVTGAEDYQKGKSTDFSKVGVKAVGDTTLVVTLRKPKAYWIHVLANFVTFPIRKDVIAKFGDRWTDPANIVTAGPYLIKSVERDSKIVLEKNPNYFRPEQLPDMIERVVFRVVKDNSTAIALFNSHDLDIVRDLSPVQLRELSKRPDFLSSPFLRGYYVGFNLKDPAVSDIKIRKALAYAIDRNELQNAVGKTLVTAAKSWIPPGIVGYDDKVGLGFNPDLARKLWAEVKTKPAQLEYWYNEGELYKLVAENLQNQWKRVLGVDIQLNSQEWKVYIKTLQNKAPALYRMGWGADYPDADTFMSLFTCGAGTNNTGWCDPKYDTLVQQAAGLSNEQERAKTYDEAQKMLLEDAVAIVPLFTQSNLHMVSSRVTGFKPNPMGYYSISQLRIR